MESFPYTFLLSMHLYFNVGKRGPHASFKSSYADVLSNASGANVTESAAFVAIGDKQRGTYA